MKLKFFLFFLIISTTIVAQESDFDKDIKHFIEINGTMNQYEAAISKLIDMFKQEYKDKQVPQQLWDELLINAQGSLKGLSNDLVVVYRKFFTHEEIKELNSFYEKDIAQKFINNVPQLTEASQQPSIVWSRSLYNQLTDALHEKGYTK